MRYRSALLCALLLVPLAVHRPGAAAEVANDRESVEHALNRLAFGPRPGDVEAVRQLGLARWIDQQLDPAKIDNAALESRLPALPARPAQFASQQEARQFGRQSVQALAGIKVTRAVHSERQLEEVLVDFWFNHFNVFAGKGRTGLYVADYEREAIRPHVLGSFRELLGATAKSPAMLFYLDNWLSADPESAARAAEAANRRRARQGGAGAAGTTPQTAPPNQQRRRGLNENYARELLELHTLGVEGGYTQKDIIEVARAFTGWTIAPPTGGRPAVARRNNRQTTDMAAETGDFRFAPGQHDRGEKTVLGKTLKAGGGIDDGERVLDIVAAHPSTARHVAMKLARRFVSDTPSEALITRVAARFTETNGDLRAVVRAVITSPEFFAADARRAKVKTPLEFVASAHRATGRDVTNPRRIVQALQQLGMAPYMCQPPTGYDDTAESWISAGALVARMNIAQQIAGAQASTIGGPDFQRR